MSFPTYSWVITDSFILFCFIVLLANIFIVKHGGFVWTISTHALEDLHTHFKLYDLSAKLYVINSQ